MPEQLHAVGAGVGNIDVLDEAALTVEAIGLLDDLPGGGERCDTFAHPVQIPLDEGGDENSLAGVDPVRARRRVVHLLAVRRVGDERPDRLPSSTKRLLGQLAAHDAHDIGQLPRRADLPVPPVLVRLHPRVVCTLDKHGEPVDDALSEVIAPGPPGCRGDPCA